MEEILTCYHRKYHLIAILSKGGKPKVRFTFEKRPGVAVEVQLYSENGVMLRQLVSENSLVMRNTLERFQKKHNSIFYGELLEVKFFEKVNDSEIDQIVSLDGRFEKLIGCNMFEKNKKKTIVVYVKL